MPENTAAYRTPVTYTPFNAAQMYQPQSYQSGVLAPPYSNQPAQGFGLPEGLNFGGTVDNFAAPAGGYNTQPAGTNWLDSLGKYGQTIGQVGQGLGALYGAYNASKQLALMRDNLRFQKEAYGQNMANSIQSYNTALTDRINGRTANYAGKEADVAAYLAANSLKTVAPTKKKK